MYGKIHESILDSSLAEPGEFVTIYVFSMMIVLADEDGFVMISERALFDRLKFPNDFVAGEAFRHALRVLESPDECSNLDAEGGRRIIPLSQIDEIPENRGWWIVNYLVYRDKAEEDERKEARKTYMRNYMARRRAKEKDQENQSDKIVLTSVNSSKQKSSYTDTDTDTDIKEKTSKKEKTRRLVRPTVTEVKIYMAGKGIDSFDAETFVSHYQANGWMRGKTKIKDWKAAVRYWHSRRNTHEKSQRNSRPESAIARLSRNLQESIASEKDPGNTDN